MFDHLGIVFRDLRMASAFYRAVLAPLGIKVMEDHTGADGTGWLVFSTGAPESPFFVVAAGRPSFWADEHEAARSPAHVAFRAPSRAAVDAFHCAGLAAAAANNGDPGVRRGRYYCAFLIDPDGNNIEAGAYADAGTICAHNAYHQGVLSFPPEARHAFCIGRTKRRTGRRTMRTIGLVLLSIAIMALLVTDADARRRSSAQGSVAGASRSWCATYPGRGINDNCSYSSYNQCYQTVLGLGGFCRPNPFPGTAFGTGYSWSGPMR